MTFILHNIEKKLQRSVLIKTSFLELQKKDVDIKVVTQKLNNEKISIVLKKLLLNFIFFFSKNLRNKKKNIKNLLLFLSFYQYYNKFFFNNKLLFYKKYFLKTSYNTFYLNKFFLSTKQIRLNPALHRLKAKRIAFFKKHIWHKNKRFRKKNILIFNKKFFKLYSSTRFNTFIVESLLHYSRIKRIKILRILKKRFYGLLNKKYYYLFIHKHHIFSRPKKRYNKKKLISYNFRYKTYPKIYVNRKFYTYRRRKLWRQAYHIRKRRRTFMRVIFSNFDSKNFDNVISHKFKKNKNYYSSYLFTDYLETYSKKLSKKYSTDKNFFKNFYSKKNFVKRIKNLMYYFKWKPKILNFHFFYSFKKNENIKKILFSAIWFKLFQKKIFWKKKKLSYSFSLFFYNNFFLNKSFILFNLFFRSKFCFMKPKQWMKRNRIKRRRFTIYIKRLRRRVIKNKIKRKFIRFFLILLFFRLMKKHKNAVKIILLKNSYLLSRLKAIKLNLLSSLLLGTNSFYFKNNCFMEHNVVNFKQNLKIVSLLHKNKI